MRRKEILLILVALIADVMIMTGSVPRMLRISHSEVESGFQDWAIAQDSLLRIYVGNQEGLLRYDGERWSGFYLPNQSAVHALYCAGDTIYVGGFDEFGYFAPHKAGGGIVYNSLSDGVKTKVKNITEVRNICRIGTRMYIQTDHLLFEAEGVKVSTYRSPVKMTAMCCYMGQLVIGAGDNGLLFFKDGKFSSYSPTELKGKYIVQIYPYRGKMLTVTANSGLYTMDMSRNVEKFNSNADSFLERGNISSISSDGDNLAFGSLSRGVCVLNTKSGDIKIYDERSGLANSTVYSVFYDVRHDLWAGGEDGLTLMVMNSPVSHIVSYPKGIGIGYATSQWQGRYYLGSSRGLFYLDNEEIAQPENRLVGYQPPVMHLASIGDDLFVCTNDGLYVLTSGGVGEKIVGVPGAYCVKPLHSDSSTLIVSTNDNFYLVRRENGKWHNKGKIQGYSDVNGRFEIDRYDDIWISHWLKGVFRLSLSNDMKRFSRVALYDMGKGFPDNAGNTLVNLNGDVAFSTRNGIYTYDRGRDVFERDEHTTGMLPHNPSASVTMDSFGTMLSVSPDKIMLGKQGEGTELMVDSSSYKIMLPELLPGYVEILPMQSGDMLMSTRSGFVKFDTDYHNPGPERRMQLIVSRITTPDNKLIYEHSMESGDKLEVEYADNDLRFYLSLPEYRAEGAVLYSYRLKGYEKEWSRYGRESTKEYTRLPEGDYTLEVRALDTITDNVYHEELPFKVRAPWYRSMAAIIVYLMLMIAGGLIGYRLLRKYIRQKMQKARDREREKLVALQRETEMQRLKDEYELERMAREQMEHNIKVKSEELSNTTMNVIRKNELLNNIMGKMRGVEETVREKGYSSDVKKSFSSLRRLISDNIEHDDDWKKFTSNFDVVYNNFSRRLLEQYPELTKSELKVCCYIKMGLSSKEISSIFNLSVRSIEMYRYQIRPKLGLGHGDRLSTFLENF